MKILGLTTSNSGCGYHRISVPICHLPKEKGRITDDSSDEVMQEGWDIVYINRLWHESIFEQRKKYGFKLVLDLDDYWVLDHDHHQYDDYRNSGFDSKVIRFIRESDLVTCTHERLADRIKPYNQNVIIVPNAIPYGWAQFTDDVEPSDKVRLFWAGGISHEKDLKRLDYPMTQIAKSPLKEKVSIVMGGYANSNWYEANIWDNMVKSFTANGHLQNNIMRGRQVYEYYDFFKFADVFCIPLQKSMFNEYKSNLKILEAAGKGIPVIVSSVHPYLGFPEDLVNYAGDSQMWVHWINKLVNNPELRKEQGAALAEYCKLHYNFDKINIRRHNAFKSLLYI